MMKQQQTNGFFYRYDEAFEACTFDKIFWTVYGVGGAVTSGKWRARYDHALQKT